MNKWIARLILLALTALVTFGIYYAVVMLRGPEDTLDGNVYTQKKLGFRLVVPTGWYPEKMKGTGAGQLYIKRYGAEPPSMSNPAAYLPLVSMDYTKISSESKTPIKRQMEGIIKEIKGQPDLYQGVNVLTQQINSHKNYDSTGTLIYTFRGALGRTQQTEIHYYLKNNILIWFTLADIEKRFNNSILNQLVAGLSFG
ncbi:MAG: hypothetical protein HYZ83_07105 [Candidatus Omnitrophica bacterium]|nr:hypothetical protein [Candidatus Omnitrophota bacterium]